MNKIIEKTVESKYAPHDTNVSWLDVSGDKPVKKYYINGKWVEVGGSGGGSSNPTEADATKVWQVTPVQKGVNTEEIVIVPEQTLVNEQELEYNDKFVPGAQCIAVIDGVEYRGEVMTDKKEHYVFETEFGSFIYYPEFEKFQFYNHTESPEVTAKLSVIEETPTYDYNWAPGVKIPIPTAEDEGKILVVIKTEGNTSIIVPEQEVPADDDTPLTNVDMTKFVVGNTVKVTITYEEQGGEIGRGNTRGAELANSETFTAIGVIEEGKVGAAVIFRDFVVWQKDNSLFTNAADLSSSDLTIKLEYIELNYEYQLQENGGGGSTSDVLWPALYKNELGDEIMATFVPEDVEPNTWCMVCGTDGYSKPVCYPVLISSYQNYTLYNGDGVYLNINTAFGGVGELLTITSGVQ